MKRLIFGVLIFLLFFCGERRGFGDDTDIFTIDQSVKPNVLIIFDNSNTMNDLLPYDPSVDYPDVGTGYERNAIYVSCVTGWQCLFCWDPTPDRPACGRNEWPCAGEYKTTCAPEGKCQSTIAVCPTGYRYSATGYKYKRYTGSAVTIDPNDVNGWYDPDPRFILGNRVRYELMTKEKKVVVAKRAVANLIQTTANINFGLMTYAIYGTGDALKGGYLVKQCGASTAELLWAINVEGDPAKGQALNPRVDTPLAATLRDAQKYFNGTWYGTPSPIQFACQKSYVIIMTDGMPWKDITSPSLDSIAGSLYTTDFKSTMEGVQNVTTYTIGFTLQDTTNLLGRTATAGGGRYISAGDTATLSRALRNIIEEIQSQATVFAGASIPASGTASGDFIYVPLANSSSVQGLHGGDLRKEAVASVGSSTPSWSVNARLAARTTPRTIYTSITGSHNEENLLSFDENDATNFNILKSHMGYPTRSETAIRNIFKYVQGLDVLNEDAHGTDQKRSVILGAIAHSTPLLVKYSESSKVVYFGANDGMLHAIDDATGDELWAFIPHNLLSKLYMMTENPTVLQYYVDGSPKLLELNSAGNIVNPAESTVAQRILVFGERKGGDAYYALDVTDRNSPTVLWGISSETTGFSELGQTWSDPVFGTVKVGSTFKAVAFVGGGYSADDSKGRAVYAVDVRTGAKVWSMAYNATTNPGMTFSIPSQVLTFDSNDDGYIDRVYVGDLGGQMWAFALFPANADDSRKSDGNVSNWTARLLFKSNAAPTAGGAGRAVNRQIFYPPDLVNEHDGYYLYFGTGNRESPKETGSFVSDRYNRFYCVKDRKKTVAAFTAPLQEGNLEDATTDALQIQGADRAVIIDRFTAKDGWVIKLNEHSGEKVLAPPTVFLGVLFFTTFAPNPGGVCSVGGEARVYAVNYQTAASVTDWNSNPDLRVRDVSGKNPALSRATRALVLSAGGIPTEVVIVIKPPVVDDHGIVTGSTTAQPLVAAGTDIVNLGDIVGNLYLTPYSWREVNQ